MKKRLKVWWDDHTDKVTRRAKRWAATDRGWLFTSESETSLGHYLDYGPCSPHYAEDHDGCTVHAVSVVARESRWCRDVAEAKLFIESWAFIPMAWIAERAA